MKKRSLSLFLALLMVFGSVLPVFATEPAVEAAAEEQTPTYTYADMYVQDGLQFRWDAYDLKSIDGTELTMTDKDGRGKALTLADVVYNSEYKVPETVSPIDFSSLVPKGENGEYGWENIEFELVLTQTKYTGGGEAGTSPYINLGPYAFKEGAGIGDGYKHVSLSVPGWANGNYTHGGYAGFQLTVVLEYATAKSFDFAEGSVAVPTRQTQYAFTQVAANGSFKRWFGNTLGQSYSVGAAMTFTLPEDSMAGVMSLALFRDRLDARNGLEAIPGVSAWDIVYIPGKTAIRTGSIADEGNKPTSYEQADEFAKRDLAQNIFVDDIGETHFRVGGVYGATSESSKLKVGYHAFRLYNRLLTDAERQQNHFADLCAYHQIDPEKVAAYVALDADSKKAIYSQPQFCKASISQTAAENMSFEEVTKEQLEEAIDHIAKNEKLASLYVEGYTALWSAFGAKTVGNETVGYETVGVINKGAELTYAKNEGGSAAYGDGYLRLVNGQLKVSNAYATNTTGSYTTEMIYATYDAQRPRDYTYDDFKTNKVPIFAEQVNNVFTVWGVNEDLCFTDANGKALQEAWASAFRTASGGGDAKAKFWTPISEADYNAMNEAGQSANIRQNSAELPAVGAYSTTGYEANWDGYVYAIATLHKEWDYYYHGYNYTQAKKPGIGNSYIMKSEVGYNGGYTNIPDCDKDFDNWGLVDGSNWSRYDFNVVASHTWTESYNGTRYEFAMYSDNVMVTSGGVNGTPTFKTDFIVNGFDANYYAIRIYDKLLTDAEKAQNHFVDLANYVEIDIDTVNAFLGLSEASQKAIYTQFATTTFAGADKATIKADIEAAIDARVQEEKLSAEDKAHIAKYEKLAGLYAAAKNLTTLWSAYGAKELEDGTLIGVINNGAKLTYAPNEGGSAAYDDGFLRVINGKLQLTGAYANKTGDYTTEMIYASYDAGRDRTYTADFTTKDVPIFAEKVEDVFNVWTASTDITFTDAEGKNLQEEWAKSFLLAAAGSTEGTWFPISAEDYAWANSKGYTVEEVKDSNDKVIGYQADYDTFAAKIVTGEVGDKVLRYYYHGFYFVSQQYEGMAETYPWLDKLYSGNGNHVKPGIGNSYVMKSEVDVKTAGIVKSLIKDFENWGLVDGSNWSRHDFGVVTSHTWEESFSGSFLTFTEYGDDVQTNTVSGSIGLTPSTDFVANGFDADYYAIRIYNKALSPSEKAQNHFVDLISYHDIDIDYVEMFEDLLKAGKATDLYNGFASTMVKDTTKAELESAIVAASLGTTSTALVKNYVSFKGYQVKVYGDDPGLRAVFNVNKNGKIDNVELVEVGAIMAIKGDRTVADLTVAKNENDVYEAVGAQMMNAAVYKNDGWVDKNIYSYEDEDGVTTTTFSYTCIFDNLEENTPDGKLTPAGKLQTKLLFRGYAVVKVGGVEYVFYTDMTSETFPNATTEGVSMYDLSLVVPGSLSDKVINIVTPPPPPPSEEEVATGAEG